MSYSLIIPIYNEGKKLRELLKDLKSNIHNSEIILINDGSTDKTKSILEDLENQKLFKIIHKQENGGKGSAIIAGCKIAKNKNIILMDSDLEISIYEIPKMIKKFEKKDLDVLVGNRWNGNEKFSDLHFLGNLFINLFFNFLFRTNFNDILCCLKIINVECYNKLNLKSKGFGIESEIMSKIILNGFSIKQKQINYKRRSKSEGKKLKSSDAFVILWTIIKHRYFKY